ncbi:DUF2218 domain-containing protein [Kitasatospora sp. NPDC089509]|uniref:DUF2218 domain-containing protein n=1 Tax=Kitasatospora sp. NPDC089509 TaxID=3364079 RepID=UPI003803D396
MPLSTSHIATDRPERYLKQLVNHLGHKTSTTLDSPGHGTVTLDSGASCVLTARPGRLELIAAAADTEALHRVQDVVARHLVRFATQEELTVEWSAPVDGAELEPVHPLIDGYLLRHCTPADQVLDDLAERTRQATGRAAGMQVSADEGALLTMLVRMLGAKYAVEVGVFTGYSSLCIARGLAEGGRLLACDTNAEWTAIGQEHWERAGVADRIDLRIAPALDTLRALPDEPHIDIAFIDADKRSYPAYYEEILRRLRPGGVVVLDNVLLGGRSLDPAYQEEHDLAMRRLNAFIAADDQVDAVMLPVRDGVTLARKR